MEVPSSNAERAGRRREEETSRGVKNEKEISNNNNKKKKENGERRTGGMPTDHLDRASESTSGKREVGTFRRSHHGERARDTGGARVG